MAALVGEVLEQRDGRWRTVRLGESVRVTDRRRAGVDEWRTQWAEVLQFAVDRAGEQP
jgi:hypothetical protein